MTGIEAKWTRNKVVKTIKHANFRHFQTKAEKAVSVSNNCFLFWVHCVPIFSSSRNPNKLSSPLRDKLEKVWQQFFKEDWGETEHIVSNVSPGSTLSHIHALCGGQILKLFRESQQTTVAADPGSTRVMLKFTDVPLLVFH